MAFDYYIQDLLILVEANALANPYICMAVCTQRLIGCRLGFLKNNYTLHIQGMIYQYNLCRD
jgi:hypothetical protein